MLMPRKGKGWWGLIVCCCLLGPLAAQAAPVGPPAVSGCSLVAEGQILVYGAHFDDPALRVNLYTEPTRKPDDKAPTDADLTASLQRVLAGRPQWPAEPAAKDPRWREVDGAESNVLTMNAGGVTGAFSLIKVLWVRNAQGVSRPYVLNRPEIWGVSPHGAVPGHPVTVWGVNVGYSVTTPYPRFAVVSDQGQVVALLTGYFPSQNQHPNRVQEFRFYRTLILPENLAPGTYTLYCWNGWGDLGWSEGHALEVAAQPQPPAAVLKLTDFGAVGDGVSDDTQAFLKAFQAAKEAGGGQITVPPGRYVVGQVLDMPAGVSLVGVSRDSCRIVPSPVARLSNPEVKPGETARWYQTYFLRLAGNCTLSDLTIDATSSVLPAAATPLLFIYQSADNVTLRRLAVLSSRGAFGEYGKDEHFWNLLTVTGDTRNLVVEGCLFSTGGTGAVSSWWCHMTGARFVGNTFTCSDLHGASTLVGLAGVTRECLFEDNVIENAGRGKTGGSRPPYGGQSHDLWLHNIFRNLWKSDGEILMYETGSMAWHGAAAGGDDTHIVAQQASWAPSDPQAVVGTKPAGWRSCPVLITSGTGAGQFRTVIANDAKILTVDRPWLVPPDETSNFGLVESPAVEELHVGNEYYRCHNYTGMYGSGLRNVWVNEIYENVTGGLFLWAIGNGRVMFHNLALAEKLNSWAGIMFINSRGITTTDEAARAEQMKIVKLFGNEIRACSIRERSYVSSENGMIWNNVLRDHWASKGVSSPLTPVPGTEAGIVLYDEPPSWGGVPTDPVLDTFPVSTRWNLIAENQIVRCPVGIQLGKAVDHTVLWSNTFYETPTPVQDLARNTMNMNSFVSAGGKPVAGTPQP